MTMLLLSIQFVFQLWKNLSILTVQEMISRLPISKLPNHFSENLPKDPPSPLTLLVLPLLSLMQRKPHQDLVLPTQLL